MALIDTIQQISNANRVADLDRRSRNIAVVGDFEGSVTGKWVILDQTGAGIVEYEGKQYVTKPIGFTSIVKGKEVELSYANGIYYSKW